MLTQTDLKPVFKCPQVYLSVQFCSIKLFKEHKTQAAIKNGIIVELTAKDVRIRLHETNLKSNEKLLHLREAETLVTSYTHTSRPSITAIKLMLSFNLYYVWLCRWEKRKTQSRFKPGRKKSLWFNGNKSILLTPVTNPTQLRGTEPPDSRRREKKTKIKRTVDLKVERGHFKSRLLCSV